MYVVEEGKKQRLPVSCNEEKCTGIYATSQADPDDLEFIVGKERFPAPQKKRITKKETITRNYLPPEKTPPNIALLAQQEAKSAAYRTTVDKHYWANGYTLPVIGPASNFATQRYHRTRMPNGTITEPVAKPPHGGVDIAAETGTSVKAPLDGKVVLVGENYHFDGNMIVLNHGDGLFTSYLHLSRMDVKEGQIVKHGQVIGAVGATGYGVTGAHLHWSAKYQGKLIDPHSLEVLKH